MKHRHRAKEIGESEGEFICYTVDVVVVVVVVVVVKPKEDDPPKRSVRLHINKEGHSMIL